MMMTGCMGAGCMGQAAMIPVTPTILAEMTPDQTVQLIDDIAADSYKDGYKDGKHKGLAWGIGGTLLFLLVAGQLRRK